MIFFQIFIIWTTSSNQSALIFTLEMPAILKHSVVWLSRTLYRPLVFYIHFFLFPIISSKCWCGLEKALYQSYFHFLNRKISETDLSRARSDAESSGDLVQNWHIHSSTRTEVDAGRHELKGDNRKKDDQESTHSEWSWRKSGIRNKFDTLKNKISKVFRKSDDTQW